MNDCPMAKLNLNSSETVLQQAKLPHPIAFVQYEASQQ